MALFLTACAGERKEPGEPAEGTCATLTLFSDAILDVMHRPPGWGPVTRLKDAYQTQWTIQDDSGSHALIVMMAADGCICASTAMSQFRGSRSQGEVAGQLQGAAVAAVSDLSYTDSWLQPKLIISCPLAYLLGRPYGAEKSMPDGTMWRLACSFDTGVLSTTLSITTPRCAEPLP